MIPPTLRKKRVYYLIKVNNGKKSYKSNKDLLLFDKKQFFKYFSEEFKKYFGLVYHDLASLKLVDISKKKHKGLQKQYANLSNIMNKENLCVLSSYLDFDSHTKYVLSQLNKDKFDISIKKTSHTIDSLRKYLFDLDSNKNK